MKYLVALAPICALLFLSGCTQSPEKLLAVANKYHDNKKYKEASILYQKAITKDKTNAEAYYREGLNLLDDHQPGQAAQFLRRAIDLKPDNMDAQTKLAEIYLQAYATDPAKFKNLLPEVQDLTNKILQRQPNSYNGLRLQALLALANNDIDKALATFAKANQVKPYSRDLVGWYAQTLLAAKRPDDAMALVKDTLAHDKTWGPGYDFLFVQYGRANDRDKAEAALRERLQNDPNNAIALTNLANYLAVTNRFDEAQNLMRKVLDDKKNFPNGHQLLGDFYFRSKKYDDALQQYQTGIKEDAANTLQYQQRIIAVYQQTNRHAQALELAKDLAAKNPKDPGIDQLYASLLLQSNKKDDLTKSLAELKTLVQNNPASGALHLDLARAYLGLNDSEKALSESLEASRRDPRQLGAHIIAGRIYADRGDQTKALEQSNAVLEAEPGNPEAMLIRDRALIGLNQPDKAQPELENLLQKYPQLKQGRLELASIYMSQKQYDKAAAQFDQVWKANPPDVRGFIGLQTIKLMQGKPDEAIHAVDDLVQKNPTALPLRFELANFQATAGTMAAKTNPDRAKQYMQQAADNYKEILKTTANSADVWLRLGLLQRNLHQYDSALASFQQAASANPKSVLAYLNAGLLYDEVGKKKEAADAYQKVLGLDPGNSLALNNLAFMNAEAGTNLDQAMTYATKAKQQVPNSPDISDTLGYVYYQKNLTSEALQIFKQNVQQYPENPTFHFHLALALLKTGDKRGARDEAEKALKIPSSPQEQSKIRSLLTQIG